MELCFQKGKGDMYYDKEAYKFEDLNKENKLVITSYNFAIEDASNKEYIIEDLLGLLGDDSTMGKIKREIAEETIDAVVEYMESQRDMTLVALLDDQAAQEE